MLSTCCSQLGKPGQLRFTSQLTPNHGVCSLPRKGLRQTDQFLLTFESLKVLRSEHGEEEVFSSAGCSCIQHPHNGASSRT